MTARPAIPQSPVGADESSTRAQPAASPLPALSAADRKAALAFARDIAAGNVDVDASNAINMARVLLLMIERSHERVMPVYAAALDWARAITAGRDGEWFACLAMKRAAIRALELEESNP